MAARWLSALAMVLLALTVVATAQTLKAPLVDEAAEDPVFAAYRARLLDAVVRRDIDSILTLVSPDINLSFGGQSGRADMRAMLTLDPMTLSEEYRHEAPALREAYWAALEDTLRLGGGFSRNGTEFAAPWIWMLDLPDGMDAFETYWVTAEDVVLRDRPSRWGREMAQLRFDIVTRLEGSEGTSYGRVRLADGTEGYVHKDYLRSYVDYRAIFRRRQGEWQMVTFIAGD